MTVQFGQRTIAQFPLIVSYDLATGSTTLNLGGTGETPQNDDLAKQIVVSLSIVIILFIMLVYLIYLRRNRIKAEEWLEQNKSILFNSALGLKSEEEILEALVKSQKMQEKLNNPQVQQAVAQQNAQMQQQRNDSQWSDEDKNKPLLNAPKDKKNDSDSDSDKSDDKKGKKGIHTDSDDEENHKSKHSSKSSNHSQKSDKKVAPQTGKQFAQDP